MLQENKLEAALKKPVNPSLVDIEKTAAIGLQFGHPLIASGYRPVPSSLIMIGMMNCRPPQPITDVPLNRALESTFAKQHGVILVSFGSILKSKYVSIVNCVG